MDPTTLALLAAIGIYILVAPDPITASTRSGAAAAIGSGARAAAQSIGTDMRSAAERRSGAHKDRVDGWKAKAAGSRSARLMLRLDRVFGRGGAVESAGRRIGAHGRAAVQAGRVGWEAGRESGRTGLPGWLSRRVTPALRSGADAGRTALGRSDDDQVPPSTEDEIAYRNGWTRAQARQMHRLAAARKRITDQMDAMSSRRGWSEAEQHRWIALQRRLDSIEAQRAQITHAVAERTRLEKKTNLPATQVGTNGGSTPVAKSTTAQAINTEAGLLPVAEQIVAATAELGQLIEAAQASLSLQESLTFDPGSEVKAAMGALAESAPTPDSLRAFSEQATGFKTAVEAHLTAIQGA